MSDVVCHLCFVVLYTFIVFFFKQKTAYEMRISDWSSDVCSSDLVVPMFAISTRCAMLHFMTASANLPFTIALAMMALLTVLELLGFVFGASVSGLLDGQIGRASCRARVCQYV